MSVWLVDIALDRLVGSALIGSKILTVILSFMRC